MVDSSLFGCGPIPPFEAKTPNEAQKSVLFGSLYYTTDYRVGTFFNCTKEPNRDTSDKMMKAPCLECGQTSNFCYFYDGYADHIDNCLPFRVAIPVRQFGNFSGVQNLRGVLQEGFEIEWDGICNSCLENDLGRCGYVNQERKSGEEYCFCSDGIHKDNCTDGVIVELDAVLQDSPMILPTKKEDSPKIFPKKHQKTQIVVIGISAVLGGFVMILLFVYRRNMYSLYLLIISYWRIKIKTPTNVEIFLEGCGCLPVQRYRYSDVRKITNSFKDILGQGGYGCVFKGKLHDGRLVAVKVLNESKGKGEDFINEVTTIGRTNHVNVVNLVGFCTEGTKRALVYEFMPNGSLERFIYHEKFFDTTTLPLGWEKLYEIALGIARGLEYLHRGCNTRILHFDIKPHNILLDHDFCPKISDFGLAKLCPTRESVVSMVGARGTIGYIAPYCRNFGGVSHKSDVYSYGMMVLKMIGGRKNIDATVENISEIYFPQRIYNRIKRDIKLEGLEDNKKDGPSEIFEDQTAKKMIIIALWCIQAHRQIDLQ